jgi:hypothetical protein
MLAIILKITKMKNVITIMATILFVTAGCGGMSRSVTGIIDI